MNDGCQRIVRDFNIKENDVNDVKHIDIELHDQCPESCHL